MERRDHIDRFGAVSLITFAALLGFNQVVIKVGNGGFQPVFFAGLRSALAVLCLWAWIRARGRRPDLSRSLWRAGILIGAVFSAEFLCLFMALDLTTVGRSAVIFYSMPLWLALAAHVLVPGERITGAKALGLVLAFAGVAWALLDRPGAGGAGSLVGDLFALGAAFGWAGVALCVRLTRLADAAPETQLYWQVLVSAPILLAFAPAFGPFLRDPAPIHLASLVFQAVVIVSAAFMAWFWLLARYPAAGVASFSFLSPIFGVALGWLVLDEPLGGAVTGALALVASGLVLINLPPRRRPQPPA